MLKLYVSITSWIIRIVGIVTILVVLFGLYRIFSGNIDQGFMGLGLVVGVAAIGVLSIRAVVERRQSIGMLRAIGYRSQMIQIQFWAEALFITLMGVLLGLALGTLTSWNIFNAISEEVSGLEYSIPWGTVLLMLGITSFFALLSAYLPAKQAGKIYPAEALRYE